ncbi:MAG: YVTN family beta-propeller repeat-containing protein, partial [Mucinivorans sp.]
TRGLEALNSPFLMDGKLSPKAEAGRAVFDKLRCGECHSGPYYTDMKMHRIGENIEFEAGWDTPTLREVWRTAPYLFDGRAATMREVFSVHKHGINRKISDKEIDELTEYVNSL